MGGHPYWYVVPYESDIDAALRKLKQREFEADRYNPVIGFLEFPIGPNSPSPGRQHASIAEAIESADTDGTRSILDMMRGVLPSPYNTEEGPHAGVSPLAESDLVDLFGDARPSRQAVENCEELWDRLERGRPSMWSSIRTECHTKSTSQAYPSTELQKAQHGRKPQAMTN